MIKIEHPDGGDDTRAWGPPFWHDMSTYFISCNRNKRSVALDLKCPEGRAAVLELVAHSDVVVENFLPGKLDALGLGFRDAIAVNPRIVYASISGFGATGTMRSRPGYDVAAAAEGGLLSITGPAEGPPCKVRGSYCTCGMQRRLDPRSLTIDASGRRRLLNAGRRRSDRHHDRPVHAIRNSCCSALCAGAWSEMIVPSVSLLIMSSLRTASNDTPRNPLYRSEGRRPGAAH